MDIERHDDSVGPAREHGLASGRGSVSTLPRSWAQTRDGWTARDSLALIVIPLIFTVSMVTVALTGVSVVAGVVDSLIRVGLCVVLLWLYRPLLADHWAKFREHPWRNTGIVLLGAVLLQVVISAVQLLLPRRAATGDDTPALIDPVTAQGWDVVILFVVALGPLAIVMVEEAVFRHTLLVKLPWWRNRATAVIGVLLNGALFGAIHFYNFGSLLGTVPYMVVGVLMNLLYLWRRNLWLVMLIHLVNNAVLTVGGLAVLLIFRNFVG